MPMLDIIGLLGMLRVCLGERSPGEPNDRAIQIT